MAFSLLSVLGRWHAVGEGDGERVQGWFPPYGPLGLTGTFRVQGPGDQVQALHCGLLGREVSAGPDRSAVPGVKALDGVGRANDPPNFDVVVQERDELAPRVAPQPGDRGVLLAPLVVQGVQGRRGGVGAGRGVDRAQVLGQLVPVLA